MGSCGGRQAPLGGPGGAAPRGERGAPPRPRSPRQPGPKTWRVILPRISAKACLGYPTEAEGFVPGVRSPPRDAGSRLHSRQKLASGAHACACCQPYPDFVPRTGISPGSAATWTDCSLLTQETIDRGRFQGLLAYLSYLGTCSGRTNSISSWLPAGEIKPPWTLARFGLFSEKGRYM